MTKVITYGTYDLLHYGHIKLLERAKALGDYLIVGVTSDDFDRTRGKINVTESLMERVENVRRTGLADEIIVEEYEGQKIDDIKRLGVDIFTVGSDWEGKFDYLGEYCKVVYLDRTQGVSSTEIRSKNCEIRLGIIGDSHIIHKYETESRYVNGLTITARYKDDDGDIESFFKSVDAVYIVSHPSTHYDFCRQALQHGKHVLCESPAALTTTQLTELQNYAKTHRLILTEGIKTAYSTAFNRMILLAKGGKIGDIVSVDSVCTSLRHIDYKDRLTLSKTWNSITAWGPTALLPVFQLLGTGYIDNVIYSKIVDSEYKFDEFTKISFHYKSAVASIKVGKGVKSEGELIISGTKGYIYVPAPWWKTDYFEIRYENPADNKRYFYQLDGEGIRNELLSFVKQITENGISPISADVSQAITRVMEQYNDSESLILIYA